MKKLIIIVLFCCASIVLNPYVLNAYSFRVRVEKRYQHEVVLTWNKPYQDAERYAWHVYINEAETPVLVKQNSYTIENLPAAKKVKIKVVQLYDGRESDVFKELSTWTTRFFYKLDDTKRCPYLRTPRIDGNCPIVLDLYYNELANENALISYKIDDVPVTPVGNKLFFVWNPQDVTSLHQQNKLEIHIDELNGYVFDLVYYLSVYKEGAFSYFNPRLEY